MEILAVRDTHVNARYHDPKEDSKSTKDIERLVWLAGKPQRSKYLTCPGRREKGIGVVCNLAPVKGDRAET